MKRSYNFINQITRLLKLVLVVICVFVYISSINAENKGNYISLEGIDIITKVNYPASGLDLDIDYYAETLTPSFSPAVSNPVFKITIEDPYGTGDIVYDNVTGSIKIDTLLDKMINYNSNNIEVEYRNNSGTSTTKTLKLRPTVQSITMSPSYVDYTREAIRNPIKYKPDGTKNILLGTDPYLDADIVLYYSTDKQKIIDAARTKAGLGLWKYKDDTLHISNLIGDNKVLYYAAAPLKKSSTEVFRSKVDSLDISRPSFTISPKTLDFQMEKTNVSLSTDYIYNRDRGKITDIDYTNDSLGKNLQIRVCPEANTDYLVYFARKANNNKNSRRYFRSKLDSIKIPKRKLMPTIDSIKGFDIGYSSEEGISKNKHDSIFFYYSQGKKITNLDSLYFHDIVGRKSVSTNGSDRVDLKQYIGSSSKANYIYVYKISNSSSFRGQMREFKLDRRASPTFSLDYFSEEVNLLNTSVIHDKDINKITSLTASRTDSDIPVTPPESSPRDSVYISLASTSSQFRSEPQFLPIPIRPDSIPANIVTVDYANERLGMFYDNHVYSKSKTDIADKTIINSLKTANLFKEVYKGSVVGQYFDLSNIVNDTAKSKVYFATMPNQTSGKFRSKITKVEIKKRYSKLGITIDYVNEQVSAKQPTSAEDISNLAGATIGYDTDPQHLINNSNIAVVKSINTTTDLIDKANNPASYSFISKISDTKVFYRIITSGNNFTTDTSSFIVPKRPDVPNYTINYAYSQIEPAISVNTYYARFIADLNNPTNRKVGDGTTIYKIPDSQKDGKEFYLVDKASNQNKKFKSDIKTLIFPTIRNAPTITVDKLNERSSLPMTGKVWSSFPVDQFEQIKPGFIVDLNSSTKNTIKDTVEKDNYLKIVPDKSNAKKIYVVYVSTKDQFMSRHTIVNIDARENIANNLIKTDYHREVSLVDNTVNTNFTFGQDTIWYSYFSDFLTNKSRKVYRAINDTLYSIFPDSSRVAARQFYFARAATSNKFASNTPTNPYTGITQRDTISSKDKWSINYTDETVIVPSTTTFTKNYWFSENKEDIINQRLYPLSTKLLVKTFNSLNGTATLNIKSYIKEGTKNVLFYAKQAQPSIGKFRSRIDSVKINARPGIFPNKQQLKFDITSRIDYVLNYMNLPNLPIYEPLEFSLKTDFKVSKIGGEALSFPKPTKLKSLEYPGFYLYYRYKANPSKKTFAALKIDSLLIMPDLDLDISVDYISEKLLLNSGTQKTIKYSLETTPTTYLDYTGIVPVVPGNRISIKIEPSNTEKTFAYDTTFVTEIRPDISKVTVVNNTEYSTDYSNKTFNLLSTANGDSLEWSKTSNFAVKYTPVQKITNITPGQEIYYRVKADNSKKRFHSEIDTIKIASASPAPTATINFTTETTLEFFGSNYEVVYNKQDQPYTAVLANGTKLTFKDVTTQSTVNVNIPLDPDNNRRMYLRKKTTSNSFESPVLDMLIPGRPSITNVTVVEGQTQNADYSVNYKTEKLLVRSNKFIWSNDKYVLVKAVRQDEFTVIPNKEVQYSIQATKTDFRSKNGILIIKARPTIDTLKEIDYQNEASKYKFSSNIVYTTLKADLDANQNLIRGGDTAISLTSYIDDPNVSEIWIKQEATTSNFASEPIVMKIPVRDSPPLDEGLTIDYKEQKAQGNIQNDIMEWSLSSDFNAASTYFATVKFDINPRDKIYYRFKATGSKFASKWSYYNLPAKDPAPTPQQYNINYKTGYFELLQPTGYTLERSTEVDFRTQKFIKTYNLGQQYFELTPNSLSVSNEIWYYRYATNRSNSFASEAFPLRVVRVTWSKGRVDYNTENYIYTGNYSELEYKIDDTFDNDITNVQNPTSSFTIDPGKTYYIRKKGSNTSKLIPSETHKVFVPNRINLPDDIKDSILPDYSTITTKGKISRNVEYRYWSQTLGGFNSWRTGTNIKIRILPGIRYEFRIKYVEDINTPSNNRYKSNIYSYTYGNSSDKPAFSDAQSPDKIYIDYLSEKLINVNKNMEYQVYLPSSGGQGRKDIVGNTLELDPLVQSAYTIQIRNKANKTKFSSDWLYITIPSRPAVPSSSQYNINYQNSTLSNPIPDESEYRYINEISQNVDLSWTTGNSYKLFYIQPYLNEERILQIRNKAKMTSQVRYFSSDTLKINIVAKTPTPQLSIDYGEEDIVGGISDGYEYVFVSRNDVATIDPNLIWALAKSGPVSDFPLSKYNPRDRIMIRQKYIDKIYPKGRFNSEPQTLIIPDRQLDPTPLTINYITERTNEIIPSSVNYSLQADVSLPTRGQNQPIRLVPGQNIYYYTQESELRFKSNILTLSVPSRPPLGKATPFSIDYEDETLNQPLGAGYVYSENYDSKTEILSDQKTDISGQNFKLYPTNLDKVIYIAKAATASAFRSDIVTINVKKRGLPPTDVITFNYKTEKINNNTTTKTILYKQYKNTVTDPENIAYTEILTGTEIPMTENVYYSFVSKSVRGQSFRSQELLTLINPKRPSPIITIDYQNETSLENFTTNLEVSIGGIDYAPGVKVDYTKFNFYSIDLDSYDKVLNFRYAAVDGSALPSKVRVLNLTKRRDAPVFNIDYENETTLEQVTKDFLILKGKKYDTTYTIGTGDKYPLKPSSSYYFSKKWTSNSFKSRIQTIQTPDRPDPPILDTTINFLTETTFITISNSYEYSYDNNFQPKMIGNNSVVKIVPGGVLYIRTRGKNPTSVQGGYFASKPLDIVALDRPNAPPDNMFSVDFEKKVIKEAIPSDIQVSYDEEFKKFTDLNIFDSQGKVSDLRAGQKFYYRYKSTDTTFASKNNFITIPTRPDPPNIKIDYMEELTKDTIKSDIIYSIDNFVTYQTGTGDRIKVTPGVDMQFKYKVTNKSFESGVQKLEVPIKPAPPGLNFTIQYALEQTVESFPYGYEYTYKSVFDDESIKTNENPIKLIPNRTLMLRKTATTSSFASQIRSVDIGVRPEGPETLQYIVNYDSETIIFSKSGSLLQYSIDPDFSSFTYSSNQQVLKIIPGKNVFYRFPATNTNFASLSDTVKLKPRPPAPKGYEIDYFNEKTTEKIVSRVIYSYTPDFEEFFQGNNNYLKLTPGRNVYFRNKATLYSFSSQNFLLEVPDRPSLILPEIDYYNETISIDQEVNFLREDLYKKGNDFETGGKEISIVPGEKYYLRIPSTLEHFSTPTVLYQVPSRPIVSVDTLRGKDFRKKFRVVFILPELYIKNEFSPDEVVLDNIKLNPTNVSNVFMAEPIVAGMVKIQIPVNFSGYNNFKSLSFEKEFVFDSHELRVFPNPSTEGKLKLFYADMYKSVEIYTMTGNKVQIIDLTNNKDFLDISVLPRGLYILVFYDKDRQNAKSVTISKI